MAPAADAERQRIEETRNGAKDWRRWGPYVSERQWGTVREDYSPYGTAWDYLTHDQARSHAYRWGEDGIAGFCDSQQLLCMSIALWNERDPILKERLFGLTNEEGNHGEDVKELYYYLDAVPSYAYARMLYKLPQAAYPYDWLIEENARRRGSTAMEFELIDTGIFDDDRYFDVEIEYAKADVDDVLMRATVHNRGPEAASIHVLPQVWFRNIWSWSPGVKKPTLKDQGKGVVAAEHAALGSYTIQFEAPDRLLFCENETNFVRLFGATSGEPYRKDAFHEYIVGHRADAVNPAGEGTKTAGLYRRTIPAGGNVVVRVRLCAGQPATGGLAARDDLFKQRIAEADAFYASHHKGLADEDIRRIQRQAFAGLLWSRQYYYFHVREWLDGDPLQPPPPESRKHGRNSAWRHLLAADIISMPDKWEYPWFAAWDLAFHCVTLSLIDADSAKEQLLLLCDVRLMHPNGQLPAYEWAFGDVNPPVHAWAAMRVYENDRDKRCGEGDLTFLERIFHKLLLNFTWWVNRKDPEGLNIFEGGFLGLDNIGVFDRSRPLPTGGYIEQSDGTAWMAMFCLNMLRISFELSQRDPAYEDMVIKFVDHFLHIARAMSNMGKECIGLWDDEDNFFYDVLCMPSGEKLPLRLRSMVGLIPLFAVGIIEREVIEKLPKLWHKLEMYRERRLDLSKLVSRWNEGGVKGRSMFSVVRVFRMTRLLRRMLDESEFLSPYGVRALSRSYLDHPYDFEYDGVDYRVNYEPGESESALFGGNSNWRGPVWMPVNYLLIENLRRFYQFYGDGLTLECPSGSGVMMSLDEIADEICRRLLRLFLRGSDGRRPVFGNYEKFQTDPNFKDYILFHEYFHGDNGRGCGASHQTGWTALVANLIDQLAAGAAPSGAGQNKEELKGASLPA
jgi:Mannosylglycerate hydrolase MGH1-like glycoside hydrolase domain